MTQAEIEVEQLKETILQLKKQLSSAEELVDQLRNSADLAAARTAALMARLAGGLIDSDAAMFVAKHRDELDGEIIGQVIEGSRGFRLLHDDLKRALNERARKSGQHGDPLAGKTW